MNYVPLSAFNHLVRPHVGNAPIPLVEQALRLAAIEFCERTRAWRQISTVTLNTQGQAVVCAPCAAIYEFESATYNDETELCPTQYSDLSQAQFAEEAPPRLITQSQPGTVSVVPFATGTLTLSVFLRPRYDREFRVDDNGRLSDVYGLVPGFLLTQHGEAIAFGALHRLFAMPMQEWSNPTLSGFYKGEFNDQADRHFTSNLEGQHNAPLRAEPDWL